MHNHWRANNIKSKCELCCTKINNFSIKYEDEYIIKNISLHIHCGEITFIIGKNGAGKSSLIKAITGEVKHEGELLFLNADGKNTKKPVIGYVPQRFDFDKTSPISVLDLFASFSSNLPIWAFVSSKTKQMALNILKEVNAEHLIDKKLGNLSGGELQRVMLGLALIPKPNLLLLDEPTVGLDKIGKETFYIILNELRKTIDLSIVMVSHDLDMIEKFADRVVLLDKEIVLCGTPKEVLKSNVFIKAFF